MTDTFTMNRGEPFRLESSRSDSTPITGTGTFILYDRPHGTLVLSGDYSTESGKAVSTLDPADTRAWDVRVLYFEVWSTTLNLLLDSGKIVVK